MLCVHFGLTVRGLKKVRTRWLDDRGLDGL